jgi:hypothetical protein
MHMACRWLAGGLQVACRWLEGAHELALDRLARHDLSRRASSLEAELVSAPCRLKPGLQARDTSIPHPGNVVVNCRGQFDALTKVC